MLTNIKSECDVPFLKSPPLARQIIFFEKKLTSLSKMSFNVEYVIQLSTLNMNNGCHYN